MSPDVWYREQPDNFDFVRFSSDGQELIPLAEAASRVQRDYQAGRLKDCGCFPAWRVKQQQEGRK